MSFEHNSVRKNLFLSAYFCWDSGISSREMNQKFNFGELIGYGNSYMDSVFRYSKVFRLHAILHDAAGAGRVHSNKGPGYCYMTGRCPNSCLLGQVTGLFFLYVKIFLPSIFKSVNFWNSMSCIVLDLELTDKNLLKKLGLFIAGSVQGFSFCPPKAFKPNKHNLEHKPSTWNCVECGKLDYDKLFAVFYDIKVMNAEVFAKGLENCRLLTRLLGQNVEILDDYGCPNVRDPVKTDSFLICSSYFFRHKTRLHCADRKAKVYAEWAIQHL